MDDTSESKELSFTDRLEHAISTFDRKNALALIHDDANSSSIDFTPVIEMIVKYMTEENQKNNLELYQLCEKVLKEMVKKYKKEDMILGLLEVIDSSNNDDTVVSVLKAMQMCLLRPDDDGKIGAQMLEWSLNSIQSYTTELPFSAEIRNGLDKEEEQVIEEEDEIRRIIGFHFYIVMFYTPILKKVLEEESATVEDFRITSLSARNVLCCFLIQLFDKPLAYLNFTDPSSDDQPTYTNVYTRSCLKQLTDDVAKLMPNPLFLLSYGERRARWPYVLPNDFDTIVKPLSDFFLIEEKSPTTAMAVLFYVILVENMAPPSMPQIYEPIYLFEMGLYFVQRLLASSEETFRTKGLRLCIKLLDAIDILEDTTLDLDIHMDFTKSLIHVLDTTAVRRNSESGVQLLRNYIQKFRTTGAKYFHIRSLLEGTDNYKIRSLLVTLYKDVIANELNAIEKNVEHELSPYCKGDKLKELMLGIICVLPKGIKTDILQSNDVIIATLNALIFFGKRDVNNHTQLWDFIGEIDEKYLKILEKALDVTGAHYRLEEKRIRESKIKSDDEPIMEVANAPYMSMTDENRLTVIRIGQNTFHLIESLLTRLNEVIEQRNAKLKQENSTDA